MTSTDELERPAWGVWVDYKIAPPGSYACLVSRFMDNRWTDPEPQWMPAQLRPRLHGEVRVMPYLMPNDPLAAVNALPELLAIKAERDRAQRACEQMGARVTEMENLLTLCADQFRVLRRLAEGGQIHRIEAGNKRVRIALSKAVASECEISETKVRAALNQEPGE